MSSLVKMALRYSDTTLRTSSMNISVALFTPNCNLLKRLSPFPYRVVRLIFCFLLPTPVACNQVREVLGPIQPGHQFLQGWYGMPGPLNVLTALLRCEDYVAAPVSQFFSLHRSRGVEVYLQLHRPLFKFPDPSYYSIMSRMAYRFFPRTGCGALVFCSR